MNKASMKQLRETAEALVAGKITTREKLETALPVLIDLQRLVELSRRTLTAAANAAKKLSEQCTKYAVDHESAFDGQKMHFSQQGVRVGDITIDNVIYHLACGYDGYIRAETGEKLTQAFLKALPEGWFKTKVELDITKINDLNPSDEALAAAGLQQKPNDVWSIGEM